MASIPFQIGPTPNPNSIRVALQEPRFPKPVTFRSAAEAEGNALANALLSIPGVTQVFMMNNFVSVNKDPGADWAAIEPKVAEAFMRHLNG
jgi:hypothetical protein